MGGRGALVEANPLLCNKLMTHRKKDVVVNAAITDSKESDMATFYVCSLPTRSTLDYNTAQNMKTQGFTITEEIKVPCKNFSDIIKETGIVPDYVSIDVESYDLRVLRSIDFNEYPIKVILAENDDGMIEYMENHGYECVKQFRSNLLFCHK